MPQPQLVPEDLAAYFTGRPPATLRRWLRERRITRHPNPLRKNGVLYDLLELPAATRDEDTKQVITPGSPPPLPETAGLLAA